MRDVYILSGLIEDLEASIQAYRQSLSQTLDRSPYFAGRLVNLGHALCDLFHHKSQLDSLQEAINIYEKAIEHTEPELPDYLSRLSHFGDALLKRHLATRDKGDLFSALEIAQQVVEEIPSELETERPAWLVNLGNVLSSRYELEGDPADLQKAIATYKTALAFTSVASKAYAGYQMNVAMALLDQFKVEGALECLKEADRLSREGIDRTPADSTKRPGRINGRVSILFELYEQTNAVAALDEAYQLLSGHLSRKTIPSIDAPAFLSNRSLVTVEKIKRGRLENDILDRALEDARTAVSQSRTTSVGYPLLLANLSTVLVYSYEQIGEINYLEEAVKFSDEAISVIPERAHVRAKLLCIQGDAFRELYIRSNRIADINKAIRVFEEAVRCSHETSPIYINGLLRLASTRRLRFIHAEEDEDLVKSKADFERAFSLFDGANEPIAQLHSLGNGLLSLYILSEDVEYLNNAIVVLEKVCSIVDHEDMDYPRYMKNLSLAYRYRYQVTDEKGDLVRALELAKSALSMVPSQHTEYAGYAFTLGNYYEELFRIDSRQDDLDQAYQQYRNAMDASPHVRSAFNAATSLGRLAFDKEDWAQVHEALEQGLAFSQRVFSAQLTRKHKETWLKNVQGVPERAAYALAKLGRFEDAVTVLEHGRALLITESLDRQSLDTASLQQIDPFLHERYMHLTVRLQALMNAELKYGQEIELPVWLREDLTECLDKLDRITAEIAKITGEKQLKEGLQIEEIQAVAEVPLAYIVSTSKGGLVLLVSQDHIGHLWLPEVTDERVFTVLRDYLSAYANWRSVPQDIDNQQQWNEALERVTDWLWQFVMEGLLEALSRLRAEQVVVLSSGIMGLLPLHAANVSNLSTATGKQYALDEITIRYAPNAKGLMQAQHEATQVDSESILVVAEPVPVNASPLTGAVQEGMVSSAFFPMKKVLHGDGATYEAWIEHAASFSVFHFACHGYFSSDDPLSSGLMLSDDTLLSVRDFITADQINGRIAVLSACETAAIGSELPDELISLPTGLLQSGFAGVVASLWSILDESTLMLMWCFYERWRLKEDNPATALQKAQQWVRDTTNGEKSDYYKRLLDETSSSVVPTAVIERLYRSVALSDPARREHAHPRYWAAFGYYGV